MRLTVLSGFVPLLGLLAAARADDPKTRAEKFQALVKAQQKAQQDFSDAYQAAKTDADREKASKELGTRSMPARGFRGPSGVLRPVRPPAALPYSNKYSNNKKVGDERKDVLLRHQLGRR